MKRFQAPGMLLGLIVQITKVYRFSVQLKIVRNKKLGILLEKTGCDSRTGKYIKNRKLFFAQTAFCQSKAFPDKRKKSAFIP